MDISTVGCPQWPASGVDGMKRLRLRCGEAFSATVEATSGPTPEHPWRTMMFTTRRMRRVLAVAAASGATVLALAGCAGGGGGSGSGSEAAYDPDEEVTLTFTWWGNDDRAQRYQKLIDAFE